MRINGGPVFAPLPVAAMFEPTWLPVGYVEVYYLIGRYPFETLRKISNAHDLNISKKLHDSSRMLARNVA
jgi:hypothetical protein